MECARHPARTFPLLTAWLPVPLQRSPNRFPVLRGGFHYYFLDLLLAEPFRQPLQLLGVAPIPASLQWVFVFDFDISHNHRQLLFMDIDSRYPIRHKLPPGGSGERAGDTLSRVSGYRRSHGERQRTIYSLYHARSGSDRRSVSASPLITQSRHSQPLRIIVKTLSDFHV